MQAIEEFWSCDQIYVVQEPGMPDFEYPARSDIRLYIRGTLIKEKSVENLYKYMSLL